MVKGRKISLALTWLVLIVMPLPLILILNRGIIDTPAHVIVYDFGIVAYVWWLMIVLLSTRPHWLEQRVGMPALYAIHGALGVMSLVAATIHRFTSFSMFPLIKQTGDIAWYLEIVMILYAVLFLSGWLTDRINRVRQVKNFFERHLLDHRVVLWLHRLNFVAIALIWLHVQLIPRLGVIPGFRLTFDLYTVVALAVYLLWKTLAGKRTTAVVVGNQRIDDSLQEVTLRLDKNNESYQAGDYYFLSFRGKGISRESHPFSVASAPAQSPHQVQLTIHRLGNYTRQIDQIPTGTRVQLEGPFGLFDRIVQASRGPVILYGLGSGIAPLISLAGQYATKKKLHLIWSGPQVNDDYYQRRLTELKNVGVTVDAKQHRFTKQDLQQVISDEEVQSGRVIIVGSANRVLTVHKSLRQLGFKRRQLTDERMTL